jgi:hypothetical protein
MNTQLAIRNAAAEARAYAEGARYRIKLAIKDMNAGLDPSIYFHAVFQYCIMNANTIASLIKL